METELIPKVAREFGIKTLVGLAGLPYAEVTERA